MNVSDMNGVKAVGMTGGTFATVGEVLTNRTADQFTDDGVTATAGVVNLRVCIIGQWRRIVVTVATVARCNLNQRVVGRGIGGMNGFPGARMTGLAVAARGKGLADRGTEQITGRGIVTADTGKVGLHADQGVIMTTGAAGTADGDQRRMVRANRMVARPGVGMAADTVAAGGEVLTNRQTDKAAVGIVTVGTAVVGIGFSTVQGIVMTVSAVGCCDLNHGGVTRNISCMGRFPGRGMTADTVARR